MEPTVQTFIAATAPPRPSFQITALSPRQAVVLLMVGTALLRLLFAAGLGLGIDESYMVAAGRTLRLGYLDHPPASWWLAWAASQLAGSDSPLVVRLPFILLFSLSTWLMYRIAARLYDEATGFWAACLLNAVPVLGVTAGSWVLPDGPLIAALLGAMLCLIHALENTVLSWRWWLGAGACLGLALDSKYTALLSALGAAMFLATQPGARHWLARPQPYAASLLALAIFAPVLGWNAAHGWASMLFQGGRMAGGKWHPWAPLTVIAGEALYFVPWTGLALGLCLAQAARRGPADARGWLLACLGITPFLAFEAASLHAHVMYHWAAPGLMLALPLLANRVHRQWLTSQWMRTMVWITTCLVPTGALAIASEVRFNWMPAIVENFSPGADPDLAAVDWVSLRLELARRGLPRPGEILAALRWNDAGKIDYAMHGTVTVICLGNDPREYGLAAPASDHVGQDMLIVAPGVTLAELSARFKGNFDRIESLPPILLLHAGKPGMTLPLFHGFRLNGVAVKQIRTN